MRHGTDSGHPQFGGHGRAARRLPRVVLAGVAAVLLLAPAVTPSLLGGEHGTRSATAGAVTASATIASSGSYELTGHAAPSKPLRWPACRAIPYRINPAGMPSGLDAVVKESMAAIGRQTGATFRYAGTTKRSFATTTKPSAPTIYIAFTPKSRAYGHTFAWPGEIGVGGPTGAWYQDGDGHLYEAITSGRVLLSTTFRGPLRGAGASWQSLIVHEVGHALNLAHRSQARDVMNPILSARSPGRFQPDELTALKRVLQRTGCDYAAWSRL